MPKARELIFKLVISDPKTGKAIQVELKGEDATKLIGKKIGDTIPGELIGLEGYQLEIRGGSDFAGFPMLKSVKGSGKKYVWWWIDKKTRVKKLVRGDTISSEIVQINLVIKSYGQKPFEEIYKEWKEKKEASAK